MTIDFIGRSGVGGGSSFGDTRLGVLYGAAASRGNVIQQSATTILSHITGGKNLNTGRPTDDPKKATVKVRINEDMAEWLDKESRKTGKTISELIRDGIELLMLRKS